MRLFYLVFIITVFVNYSAYSQEVFRHVSAVHFSSYDHKESFDIALLDLALSLTEKEYGAYRLEPLSADLDINKIKRLLTLGELENSFVKLSARNELFFKLHGVIFPIERGVVGYRVPLIKAKQPNLLEKVHTIKDLARFASIQGATWLDVDIFKYNQLPVYTVSSYDKMFTMLEMGRADVFFRGANEWKKELTERPHKVPLMLEPYLAIYYHMPRFFFTDKGNEKNAQRIMKGLKKAYEQGSFQQLWLSYFAESIKDSKLSTRTIIELTNPFVSELPLDYHQYLISQQELAAIEGTANEYFSQ